MEYCGTVLGMMDKVARLWPMTEAVPEGRGYAERWALSSTRDSSCAMARTCGGNLGGKGLAGLRKRCRGRNPEPSDGSRGRNPEPSDGSRGRFE